MTAAYPGLCESRWVNKIFESHRQGGNGGKASRSIAELNVRGGKAFPFHQLILLSVRTSGYANFASRNKRSELCSSHCLESKQYVYERGGKRPSP